MHETDLDPAGPDGTGRGGAPRTAGDEATDSPGPDDATPATPPGPHAPAPGTTPSGSETPVPPRRSASLRPALLVGGLAVVIIVLFATIAAIGSGNAKPPPPSATTGAVRGSGLASRPAAPSLAPIVRSGEPPANIVRSLTVPVGSVRASVDGGSLQTDQYDSTVHYRIAASQGAVVDFYRSDLRRLGWRVLSTGPAQHGSGVEVLAQKGGDDGWYWEVGAVVQPTRFPSGSGTQTPGSSAPAPSSAAAKRGETTPFSLELLQEPDPD